MIILQILGWVVLGAGVIVGAVFGLCMLIARAADHDQATCDCWDCKQRRLRAWKKAQDRRRDTQDLPADGWLSTQQLKVEMVINHKGNRYQVVDLAIVDTGVIVSLSHIPTRRRSIVPISTHMLDRRMWAVEKGRWT